MSLGSSLGSRVIGDLEGSVVFAIHDAEVSKAIGNKPPFLVGVAVAWPNDELAALMRISTCVQGHVACFCQSDSEPLELGWLEWALDLGLIFPALLALQSLSKSLLPLNHPSLFLLPLPPALLSLLPRKSKPLLTLLPLCPTWLPLHSLPPTLLTLLSLLSPALSFPTHLDMFIEQEKASRTCIIPNRPNQSYHCFLRENVKKNGREQYF